MTTPASPYHTTRLEHVIALDPQDTPLGGRVGHIILAHDTREDFIELVQMWVHATHRRQGFGRQLLDVAKQKMIDWDTRMILCHAAPFSFEGGLYSPHAPVHERTDREARNGLFVFYRKNGFVYDTGLRPGFNMCYWRKERRTDTTP